MMRLLFAAWSVTFVSCLVLAATGHARALEFAFAVLLLVGGLAIAAEARAAQRSVDERERAARLRLVEAFGDRKGGAS